MHSILLHCEDDIIHYHFVQFG